MKTKVACLCQGKAKHPEGCTVTLRDKLDFHTAVTMQQELALFNTTNPGASTAESLATLQEAYLVHGIESWNVRDAKGKPIPLSRDAINEHLLSNLAVAMELADIADDLYSEAVVLPLLKRGSKSSPTSQTDDSTSAETSSPLEPPKPLRPSSTTTSRTDATATTSRSPDGDSNSSQNSASAA